MKTIIALAIGVGLSVPAAADDVPAWLDSWALAEMLAWKCQEWVFTGDRHPRNHNPFQFGTTYQLRNSSGERIQIDQSAFAAATARAKSETQDLDQSAACRLAEQQFGPEGSALRGLLRKKQ
jgi:hypothetical protein